VNALPPVSRRLDWTVLVAVVLVAASWFAMSSLSTDLGFVQRQFRFYNVLTLMHAPRSIVTGVGGDAAHDDALRFGTLCVLALVAALLPLVSRRRAAWLGCIAPLVLMAIVGAVLYHELSQDLLADTGGYGDTGSQFIRFANSMANRVGGMVARQVHVGAGGYLALAASFVLAIRGLLNYLHRT